MLALALLLLATPASALDLAVSFDGPETTGPSLTVDAELGEPRLLAVEDGLGDRWAVEITVDSQDARGISLSGTARLLDVTDSSAVRAFRVTAPFGQPVAVPIADPAGRVRLLSVVAAAPGADPEVVCEILPAPTVDDLAAALQELVDEGREPRSGVGRFLLDDELVDATWLCGW